MVSIVVTTVNSVFSLLWEKDGSAVGCVKPLRVCENCAAAMQLVRVAWALAGAALCCSLVLLLHSRFLKEGNPALTLLFIFI